MDGGQIPDALLPSANKLRSERHFPVLSASCLPQPRWIRATNPLFQVWRLLHITCYPIQGQRHVGMRGTGRSDPSVPSTLSLRLGCQPTAYSKRNLQRKGEETMHRPVARRRRVAQTNRPMLHCEKFHAFLPVCNANPHEPRLPDGFGKGTFPASVASPSESTTELSCRDFSREQGLRPTS